MNLFNIIFRTPVWFAAADMKNAKQLGFLMVPVYTDRALETAVVAPSSPEADCATEQVTSTTSRKVV